MKQEFTKSYILSNRGCFDRQHILNLMQGKDTVQLIDVLNADFPFKDKAHFLITKGELTDLEKQILNINIAEIVLPLFEKMYPNNDYGRRTIDAAKQYLEHKITLSELKKLDFDIHNANIPDLEDNLERFKEGINESAAAIFAISAACGAYNCAVDPKNYQADAVYDAYDATFKTVLPLKEKVEKTFYKIITEIFV